MLRLFIPPSLPAQRLVPFLARDPQGGTRLFQDLPPGSYENLYTLVADIADADLVALPHEYAVLRKYPAYVEGHARAAKEAGKRLLVSAYQDDPAPISMERAIILRPSAYRSSLLSNEVLMPAYVEDLGSGGVSPRAKGERPIVSFMGKAGFSSSLERAKYLVRNYILRHGPEREGVYFRRAALAALAHDARIDLRVTVRSRFSANAATIELDAHEARTQYVRSIEGAHFTLAPRGDGNYSLRFYETLAMGRIPIIIDTDMPLPLANRIPYDDFIVRVPWDRIADVPELVWNVWNSRSDDELRAMQRAARHAFERYLYMPTYLKTVLAAEFLNQIP